MGRDGDSDVPDVGEKHWIVQLLNEFAKVLHFSIKMSSHPIDAVSYRLQTPDDLQRIKEALFFFGAMLSFWFVIECPMFIVRGINAATPSGLLFFVFEVISTLLLYSLYGYVLHLALRIFRVRSEPMHTIPCFFYAGIGIPLYALLAYPMDILKYHVIDKVGTFAILLEPAQYAQVQTEIMLHSGKIWQIAVQLSNVLVDIWAIVIFGFLSVIISKLYRARYWKCLVGTLVLLIFITEFEHYLLEPVSAEVEVLFAKL
jgi:hypothetical protein